MTKTSSKKANCLTILLAAGDGKRMNSNLPKPLHEIAGLPMISHVLRAAVEAGDSDVCVVLPPDSDSVREAVGKECPQAEFFFQPKPSGTAHAVECASEAIARGYGQLVILFADAALIRPGTIRLLRSGIEEGAVVAVAGFLADDPSGYGRLIEEGESLVAVREEKDCSPDELDIPLCNGGIMAMDGGKALELLGKVKKNEATGERYLTEAVSLAFGAWRKTRAFEIEKREAHGVNDLIELSRAESLWQSARREEAMRSGVSMRAPETVWFSYDTELSPGAFIEPNVIFGPGVRVGSGARILSFSHLEGCAVEANASIGPFARLRPGAEIGDGASIGNFVEIKNSSIGGGAKVNHLAYVGDASVGSEVNIGAGAITCNFDGERKYRTLIGDGAFIGSNVALVAPVAIGKGAYVGSGGSITEDVPADALALARPHQTTKPMRAAQLRRERRLERRDK